MANVNIADTKKKDFYILSDSEGNIIKLIFPHKVQFGIDDSRISSEAIFATDLMPDKDKVRSLGSVDKQWKDLYVSEGTIFLGGARISLSGDGKVQIRDEGTESDVIISNISGGEVDNASVINAIGFTPAKNDLGNVSAPEGRAALGIQDHVTGTLTSVFANAPSYLRNSNITLSKSGGQLIFSNGSAVSLTFTKADVDLDNVENKSPAQLALDVNLTGKFLDKTNPSSARSILGISDHVTGSISDLFNNLTPARVTAGLGFTPAQNDLGNVTGPTGRAALGIQDHVTGSLSDIFNNAPASLRNSNITLSKSGGILNFNNGSGNSSLSFSKGDVDLGNVENKSPAQLASDTNLTGKFLDKTNPSSARGALGIQDHVTGSLDAIFNNLTPAKITTRLGYTPIDVALTNAPSTILNSNVTKSSVGLGNVENYSRSQLATDANFTNAFGAKSVVDGHTTSINTHGTTLTTHGNNFTNAEIRFENARGKESTKGKGKMGIFDNGRMVITENTATFTFDNTAESLKPAGWIEVYQPSKTSGYLSYKTGSNNTVMKLGTVRTVALSPAFEIKEDKYKFKIRLSSNTASWSFDNQENVMTAYNTDTHNIQLLAYYTTDDSIDGEYIGSTAVGGNFGSELIHSTNVTVLSLACTSTTNIPSNSSSYEVREFNWDPPATAKFASIGIYKYASSGELYIDWITGYADTQSARTSTLGNYTTTAGLTSLSDTQFPSSLRNSNVTATSLSLGAFEGKTASQIHDDANIYFSGLVTSVFTNNTYSYSENILSMNRQWQFYNSYSQTAGTYVPTINYNNLHFRFKGASKGYIDGTTNVSNIDFTGQHRNQYEFNNNENFPGLIVCSQGIYKNLTEHTISKPLINEALPVVELSTKRNQKSVWGVISEEEDINSNERAYSSGAFVTILTKKENDNRLIINSLGEGAIWVCNINGNLENGDYITSCEIPGYGMRQDDDLLHNYTVAKITQDCNFELNNPRYDCVEFEFEGQTYRKAFVGCTYHCG